MKNKGIIQISLATGLTVLGMFGVSATIFYTAIGEDRQRISSLETVSEMTLKGQERIENSMNERFDKLENLINRKNNE